MKDDDLVPVWKALADPTRRRILDLLSESPMTTGRLAEAFPISRIAVMKHLRALDAAGLVLGRKRGRERWHHVNFLPLQQIHERWMRPHEERWAASLLRLKRHSEGMGDDMTEPTETSLPLSIDIAQEVRIEAPRPRVFSALTADIAAWWGRPYLDPRATGLVLEPRLGGSFYEVWGAEAGALLATVSVFLPVERLELTGRLHMGVVQGVADFQLSEEAGGTLVRFTHKAIGAVAPEGAARFAEGWGELLSVRLKAYAERGERRGIDNDDVKQQ